MSANKIFTVPFGSQGDITDIPDGVQSDGTVSYATGFGPDYSRQLGTDPLAKDIDRGNFNAFANDITAFLQKVQSGFVMPYNAALSAAIGGYPSGARIRKSDGTGIWVNTVPSNLTDPEAANASGWRAEIDSGVLTIALTNQNITLTNVQASNQVIKLSGSLSANIDLFFPVWPGSLWVIENGCTGSYTVSVRTVGGSNRVTIPNGSAMEVYCDNGNMQTAVSGTAVTPPQFDNSQKIATTAFVQRALGNYQGIVGTSSPTVTLVAGQAGTVISIEASNTAVVLPLSSTVQAGATFTIVANANGTVRRQGSDILYVGTAGAALTSLSLNQGDDFVVTWTGSVWYVVSGSTKLPYAGIMSGANWTTPTQFDNTRRLATTEFVQRALGNYRSVQTKSFTALTAADVGSVISATGDLSLPNSTGLGPGAAFTIVNANASSSIVVTVIASDYIFNATMGWNTATKSITIQSGDTVTLVCRAAAGQWDAVAGSALLSGSAQFRSLKGVNGYRFSPDGTLEQWGFVTMTVANASQRFNFPIAFPVQCSNIQFTAATTAGAVAPISVSGQIASNTQFDCVTSGVSGQGVLMRAMGY